MEPPIRTLRQLRDNALAVALADRVEAFDTTTNNLVVIDRFPVVRATRPSNLHDHQLVSASACQSNWSAMVRFIRRFDGTAPGSMAFRATSTPATGSPVGSSNPNCTRTDAWSQ